MTSRVVETSPQTYARVAGWLYLYVIVAGTYAEIFVRDKLVVSGDPAATAHNIMAAELPFRVSIAIEQSYLACAVAITVILYLLLRPVSKSLSLLAAFFNLVSIGIEAVSGVSLFAVTFFYGSASYLKAFEPNQLYALAYLCLKSYDYGFGISLVFFGCCLFFYGYLIFNSGYLPKMIGVLLIVASLSYLINSTVVFIVPAFAGAIFPILVLAFVGELSLCLWLIAKGVDVQKWDAQRLAT
jgi:hypothetical protein